MNHTTPEQEEKEEDWCDCKKQNSIPFLDTSLSIENGIIDVDLYKKKKQTGTNTSSGRAVTQLVLQLPYHFP